MSTPSGTPDPRSWTKDQSGSPNARSSPAISGRWNTCPAATTSADRGISNRARIESLVPSRSASPKEHDLNRPAANFIMKATASSVPPDALRAAFPNCPMSDARSPGNAAGNLVFPGSHLPGEHKPPPSLKGLSPHMWRDLRGGPEPCQPALTPGGDSGAGSLCPCGIRTGKPSSREQPIELSRAAFKSSSK